MYPPTGPQPTNAAPFPRLLAHTETQFWLGRHFHDPKWGIAWWGDGPVRGHAPRWGAGGRSLHGRRHEVGALLGS